jgi:hypothetical protein
MALVVVDKSKPAADIEAKPGIVGGKYFVDRRIGEGSFGVIYKGIWGELCVQCVLICVFVSV